MAQSQNVIELQRSVCLFHYLLFSFTYLATKQYIIELLQVFLFSSKVIELQINIK